MARRQDRESIRQTDKSVLWAREVLLRVGIDADSADARRWLPKITKEIEEISNESLNEARRNLKAEDPAKVYRTMSELRYIGATLLLDDPVGRQALRKAMKKLRPEHLLEVLDYRGGRRRPR